MISEMRQQFAELIIGIGFAKRAPKKGTKVTQATVSVGGIVAIMIGIKYIPITIKMLAICIYTRLYYAAGSIRI